VIDLHSHILHGLDDGARTLADSLEIARAAVADGITLMAATPHVRDDYPTDAASMERRLRELREALVAQDVPLELRGGGEIALDWLVRLPADELRRFGLAGNPAYLLVETPYTGWPLGLDESLLGLREGGITPVLAHPERNAELQAAPERLVPLVEAGVLVQVTAASLDGRLGRRAAAVATALVERGLCHLVASDAHESSVRGVGLAAAAAAVGDADLARWLTVGVPGAIVAAAPLPSRPEPPTAGRSRSRGLIGRLFR